MGLWGEEEDGLVIDESFDGAVGPVGVDLGGEVDLEDIVGVEVLDEVLDFLEWDLGFVEADEEVGFIEEGGEGLESGGAIDFCEWVGGEGGPGHACGEGEDGEVIGFIGGCVGVELVGDFEGELECGCDEFDISAFEEVGHHEAPGTADSGVGHSFL